VHPLTILSGLPSAAFGALLALKLCGIDLSVIALIGLLMLIGIVKKNAIMMVDVALTLQRDEGRPPVEAIHDAAVRRFRPIRMTTFCALLGPCRSRWARARVLNCASRSALPPSAADCQSGPHTVHDAGHLRRDRKVVRSAEVASAESSGENRNRITGAAGESRTK